MHMLDINDSNYLLYLNDKWFSSLSNEWQEELNRIFYGLKDIYYKIFKLEEIFIQSKNIYDLTGLEYCINLTRINAYGSNLQSLRGIENCYNLKCLSIRKNSISSLNKLETCYNLNSINIRDNDLIYNDINTYLPLINAFNLEEIIICQFADILIDSSVLHKLKYLFPNLTNLKF